MVLTVTEISGLREALEAMTLQQTPITPLSQSFPSDPWDWTIDQVKLATCTAKTPLHNWSGARHPWPRGDALRCALDHLRINGMKLLACNVWAMKTIQRAMCIDHGKHPSLRHGFAWIRMVGALRRISPKYKQFSTCKTFGKTLTTKAMLHQLSAMQLLEDSNDKNAMQLLKDCVSKVV